MTNEDAIKWLDNLKNDIGNPHYERLWPYAQAIDEIIAMLEEQEPKHIVRKQCKKEHEDGSIDYFAEWYCPHCNMLVLRGFDNPSIKFCYKCGKPILWKGR